MQNNPREGESYELHSEIEIPSMGEENGAVVMF